MATHTTRVSLKVVVAIADGTPSRRIAATGCGSTRASASGCVAATITGAATVAVVASGTAVVDGVGDTDARTSDATGAGTVVVGTACGRPASEVPDEEVVATLACDAHAADESATRMTSKRTRTPLGRREATIWFPNTHAFRRQAGPRRTTVITSDTSSISALACDSGSCRRVPTHKIAWKATWRRLPKVLFLRRLGCLSGNRALDVRKRGRDVVQAVGLECDGQVERWPVRVSNRVHELISVLDPFGK